MSDVDAGARQLLASAQRAGLDLQPSGHRPGEVDSMARGLPLSPELRRFYEEFGPEQTCTIPWTVERLRIYSLGDLADRQAGYRWCGDGQPDPTWQRCWVVIGDRGSDPFIIDTARAGSPAYIAPHGTGRWELSQIAPDLGSFLELLAAFVDVCLGRFGRDVWDDETDDLRREFVDAVQDRISAIVGTDEVRQFIRYLNGG